MTAKEKFHRVAFQTPPGSQASPRGQAQDAALLSSRDADLLEPTEWPQGSLVVEGHCAHQLRGQLTSRGAPMLEVDPNARKN